MTILCAVCKKTPVRWKCAECDKLMVCDQAACRAAHAEVCPPPSSIEAASTVQLLEAALKKEPWRSCSCPDAVDRCGSCRLHDAYREKIEAAVRAAREFTRT